MYPRSSDDTALSESNISPSIGTAWPARRRSRTLSCPPTPPVSRPVPTVRTSFDVSELSACVMMEKKVLKRWNRTRRRYIEYQPLSNCIFYWHDAGDRTRRRAKCLEKVTKATVIPSTNKTYSILQVKHSDGHLTSNLRFASEEEARTWERYLECSRQSVTSGSFVLLSSTKQSNTSRDSPCQSYGKIPDDERDQQLKIQRIFSSEFKKKGSLEPVLRENTRDEQSLTLVSRKASFPSLTPCTMDTVY